jgi:hypothetical protein
LGKIFNQPVAYWKPTLSPILSASNLFATYLQYNENENSIKWMEVKIFLTKRFWIRPSIFSCKPFNIVKLFLDLYVPYKSFAYSRVTCTKLSAFSLEPRANFDCITLQKRDSTKQSCPFKVLFFHAYVRELDFLILKLRNILTMRFICEDKLISLILFIMLIIPVN